MGRASQGKQTGCSGSAKGEIPVKSENHPQA